MIKHLSIVFLLIYFVPNVCFSQNEPLRIKITDGVIEPVPLAVPKFLSEIIAVKEIAKNISLLISEDLTKTGLFRIIPDEAHISNVTNFKAPVAYADWKAINAQGLISGAVTIAKLKKQLCLDPRGCLVVKFKLFDIFAENNIFNNGQKIYAAEPGEWRRLAHKIADDVYFNLTGEIGYFNTKIAFISESGVKNNRLKRLAIMDYDGANVEFLTDQSDLVLTPRFSPNGSRLVYTSFKLGEPHVFLMDIKTRGSFVLDERNQMSFSPQFSPNGQSVIMSVVSGANTDLYTLDLRSGTRRRLTSGPAIETSASFSPDGSQIVYESDRSGTQQLYILPIGAGEGRRISFGGGSYGTPVWSPNGDLIAFTKKSGRRFHIGVMRTDGSEERLLTSSFLDEAPTWSPNGRVIMFFRDKSGSRGTSSIFSIDISGRNLRKIITPNSGSDPSWSPLMN
jgi:TolB protein